jgi:glutathione reductase (NADPH)
VPQSYDVLVVGTGAGAQSAAYPLREAGLRVAVVDSRPMGGTCALRGCDPKKVLVDAARLADGVQRMRGEGVRCHGVEIDWPQLTGFKRTFTQPVPKEREQAFHEAGIETLHGRARFVDRQRLDVDGQRIEADDIVIATGAKPRPLAIPGSEHVVTSAEFLDLDELPERICFVGGGYVGLEFAHLAAHAGAEAHILTRGDRVLEHFDRGLVAELVEAARGKPIEVYDNSPVREIEVTENGYRVYSDGEHPALEHDLVVHGAGRVPEIDDLDLAEADVDHDEEGLTVDEHLQSPTNEHVYAAGDAAATDGWPLTPIAAREGSLAARNVLAHRGQTDQPPATMDYAGTASVAFTIPPIARVGLTEDEAEEAQPDIAVQAGDMSEWFSYAHERASPARYKVLTEADSGRIVGAHLLGADAEETINLFALAIRQGLRAEELTAVPWAYPSHGSEVTYMV